MDVLKRVHQEAAARGAGVLFLGDFWDRRGDLPVGPLNQRAHAKDGAAAYGRRVDAPAAAWERACGKPRPRLQARRARRLRPAGRALCRRAARRRLSHISSRPSRRVDQAGRHHSLTPLAAVCRRAHVFTEPSHYAGALWLPYRRDESVLRAALAAAAGRGATKAIFAHADTMGAHMNAAHQASSGLPTDAFPLDIPVFMGHYHMPQTVPGTRITYIGSPYQVSRSEAGQSKRLLLLSPEWQAVADIPLEMGPRHFTFATTTGSSPDPSAAADGSDAASDLLTAAASAAPAAATPDGIRELLAGGRLRAGDRVRVAVADGRAVDDMAELQKGMAAAGLEVEGFGPFESAVSYPLAGRGLVALTGRNEDDGSAESNGAGKTSLATALLWAMKAEGGERRTQAQVVNENSRGARVRVWGRVNGDAFVVERSVRLRNGRTSDAKLSLEIGGQDYTQQAIDLTERVLRERFASPLLGRSMFFGQEELMALLQARDRDFKEILSAIVDTACWDTAKAAAAAQLKAHNADLASCDAGARHMAAAVERTEAELAAAGREERQWEVARQQQQAAAQHEIEQRRQQLRGHLLSGFQIRSDLSIWLEAAQVDEGRLLSEREEAERQLQRLQAEAERAQAELDAALGRQAAARAQWEEQQQQAQQRAAARAAEAAEEDRRRRQQQQQQAAGGPSGAEGLPWFDEAAAEASDRARAAACRAARAARDAAHAAAAALRARLHAAEGRAVQYGQLVPQGGGVGDGGASGGAGRLASVVAAASAPLPAAWQQHAAGPQRRRPRSPGSEQGKPSLSTRAVRLTF
ncbi:hypothetical protein MNEG_8466 [Monoraphidium neglectum]|uniref:Rad50/SbcC-type AAA domain-containing protein n=1 Tax=Monoraphidium neglectum TaxID=145388 RepID=A0A0D2MFL5_9CHLO|nr:hypothetical protein MNEG_8466 [Monoraphidium neglectum]KIY99496.1 hypothetical protein MNEG_8466 [Monoraphidium neglectum]|eukprot:XP_013898516.1 hypothetical protein MNEG_8466 [Monoraphidium neglectum]